MRSFIRASFMAVAVAAPAYAHADTYYGICSGNDGPNLYETNVFEFDSSTFNRDRWEEEFKVAAGKAYGTQLVFGECVADRDKDAMTRELRSGKGVRRVDWQPAGSR